MIFTPTLDHKYVRNGKATEKDTGSPSRTLGRLIFKCVSGRCSYIKSFGKNKVTVSKLKGNLLKFLMKNVTNLCDSVTPHLEHHSTDDFYSWVRGVISSTIP